MTKIYLILIAITLVAANPLDDDPKNGNKCLNFMDQRRCYDQCKKQGSSQAVCDKINGCQCETAVPYNEKIQCFSHGPDPRCHHYCRRKGFEESFCDKELVCNCAPLGVPYEPFESSDGDEKIMCLTQEDVHRCRDRCKREGFAEYFCKKNVECQCNAPFQPYETDEVEQSKHSCDPLGNGEFQCYNFCKDHGLRKGFCEKEGYCSCYFMDVVPLVENYFL